MSSEQSVIPWDDVPPEEAPDDDAEWVHDPKCMCDPCCEERARLNAFRKWQYAARCEADRMTQRDRVKYYRRRARRKLPLFERGPREK